MTIRKLQQGEGEDNHENEICIDIVGAKCLRETTITRRQHKDTTITTRSIKPTVTRIRIRK